MAKVLTFSRFYPSYHPKKGEPTFFVEKILRSIYPICPVLLEHFEMLNPDYINIYDFRGSLYHPMDFHPKHHTIRKGNRFKKGDYFSPRVWSGQPYNSKQVIIAPNIQVKNTWDIEIEMPKRKLSIINEEGRWWQYDEGSTIQEIAKNDGLELRDFWNWFPQSFKGQIICWNKDIEY